MIYVKPEMKAVNISAETKQSAIADVTLLSDGGTLANVDALGGAVNVNIQSS